MLPSRLLLWFCACLVLAMASRWRLSATRTERCALDGGRISRSNEVDLVSGGRVLHRFCCVRCAFEWPGRPPQARWHVRDEVTGEVLDATIACFVQSGVVTVPARNDRVHVFKHWSDAMEHVAEHGGARIANPFVIEMNKE